MGSGVSRGNGGKTTGEVSVERRVNRALGNCESSSGNGKASAGEIRNVIVV